MAFQLFCFLVITQTPRAEAVPSDFNFVAAGDWGCNSETHRNISAMEAIDPELVFALGDLSYQSKASCWIDEIDPIINVTRITIGNHDAESASLLNEYMDRFGLEKQYYSFDYGGIHFLSMSTEGPYGIGSEQYEFVKSDLQNATASADTLWRIVYFHKLMYTSPNEHGPLTDFRNIYHPLFDKYDVDLVLQAHNHNYQRSFPLTFNLDTPSKPVITTSNSSTYGDYDGEIYMVIGTGGAPKYNLEGKEPYIASQMEAFGFVNFEVDGEGRTLKGTFYASDGTAKDTFTLQKDDTSVPKDDTSVPKDDTTTPEFPLGLAIPITLVVLFVSVVVMSRKQGWAPQPA